MSDKSDLTEIKNKLDTIIELIQEQNTILIDANRLFFRVHTSGKGRDLEMTNYLEKQVSSRNNFYKHQ